MAKRSKKADPKPATASAPSRIFLVYDTETTGLLVEHEHVGHPKQPYLVQLGAILLQERAGEWETLEELDAILHHPGIEVPPGAAKVHGITTELMRDKGRDPLEVLQAFDRLVQLAGTTCAFNLGFDEVVALAAYLRVGGTGGRFRGAKKVCLMQSARPVCELPNRSGTGYKLPKLSEAFQVLVNPVGFADAHTALADARAAAAVLKALVKADAELVYERPAYVVLEPRAAPRPRVVDASLKKLDAILSAAVDAPHKLSDWERSFVDDFAQRREQYGEDTRVSPKQWGVLDKIHMKLEA